MKKGFTLVELSIVLVIIGLLIGGILVAQSLIDSTKITKLGRDLLSYKTIAIQYKERYRYWPGDNYSGCTGEDRNGIIGGYPGSAGCAGNEPSRFWRMLAQFGMIDGDYPVGYSPGSNPTYNPIADYYKGAGGQSDPGFIALYSGMALANTAPANDQLYGINLNSIRTSGSWWGRGFNTVYEAISLEKKFDDGHPGTGDLSVSTYNGSSPFTEACVSGNNTMSKEQITWNTSSQTDLPYCSIIVWLDY